MELAHPQLRVDHENKIIFRGDAPVQGKVGIVSGGGSGHEPLQGGFVGPGGLDAACAGEVFTSPVPDQMHAATKGVDGGAGVLHIVLNYTGDIMNFEMAAELAAAEDVQVETVIMNDDVAVEDSLYTAGRRGVAATILLNKIAGAAADEGRDLAAVAEVSRKVIGNARSMGMALTSCTVPAAGRPTFDLPDDQMEVGIGVHGEPGRRRLPVAPAKEVAEMLVEPILKDLDFTGGDGVLRLRQRHGRHPADRALPHVRRGGEDPGAVRRPGGPLAGRQLHDQPGHGRLLGLAAQGGRRAAAPVGRADQHRGVPVGGLSVAETVGSAELGRWLRAFADAVTDNAAELTSARLGDRRRRPRRRTCAAA